MNTTRASKSIHIHICVFSRLDANTRERSLGRPNDTVCVLRGQERVFPGCVRVRPQRGLCRIPLRFRKLSFKWGWDVQS